MIGLYIITGLIVGGKVAAKEKNLAIMPLIPLLFAGFPCDYNSLNAIVRDEKIIAQFIPASNIQEKLGRILILADAAHSYGGRAGNLLCGSLTDISVFSFHAVKIFTTAEGGAIAINLPPQFNVQEEYQYFNTFSLHGQNKDALAKTQKVTGDMT